MNWEKDFWVGPNFSDSYQDGVCCLASNFSLGVGPILKAVVVSELQQGFYRNLLKWTKNCSNPDRR